MHVKMASDELKESIGAAAYATVPLAYIKAEM